MESQPTASIASLLALRVVACGCLLLPSLGFAQVVWDNSNNNGRWNEGANWQGNNMPGASDDVQINGTDSNGNVGDMSLRTHITIDDLILNNVNDTFTISNGTGSQTLTLSTGDITRTGSANQTFSFSHLELGGNSLMDISGSGRLSIAAAIGETGGARTLTKTGDGELRLSGANTYSGNTTLNEGMLTLASSSALGTSGNLTMSGGTLRLATATTSLTNLTITGNSTIDFGGANATLNVTNFNIVGNVTLSIINWTNASDFFYATNWTGASYDTTGASPMTKVVFDSPYDANDTKWLAYGSHQITPVPEPSTYGAMLLALGTSLLAWRRRRVSRAVA